MKIPFFNREKRSAANYISSWLYGLDISDFEITADEAVQIATAFRCIALLAENTASMPLPIYEDTTGGRIKRRDLPVYNILNHQANPYVTAMDFRSAMMWQACLYGTGYAEIVRNQYGEPVELWIIPSSRVRPVIGKDVQFEITMPDSSKRMWGQEKLFRVNWLTDTGVSGIKPLTLFKKVFEIAVNTDEYANSYFKNGAAPSGILEHNIKDADQQKRMKADFKKAYTGKPGAHRLIFLEEGMKYIPISVPPNQGQMVESRRFNVIEVCRIYNVQPHKVFEMENTIKSNIEQSSQDFITTTLLPWAVRWQQSVYRDLLTKDQKKSLYAEMMFESLLRGDITTRYDAYSKGRMWGWLSANDVRLKENEPTIEGGDIYLTPMNMLDSKDMSGYSASLQMNSGQEPEFRDASKDRTQRLQAQARSKLASRNRPVFANAGTRIAKRQSNEVKKASKKFLLEGQTRQFLEWADDYFSKAPDWIKRDIHSEALSLASAISDLAASQIGGDPLPEEDIAKAIDDYSANFGKRTAESKKAQLNQVVNDNLQADNLQEMVDKRADEWEEKDGDKIAANETVFIASMIARSLFRHNGYTKLKFINTSGNPCPFCAQLDGQIVGIAEPIIPEGESILASDGSGMRIYGAKMHTPIHQGCQCDIAPE